MSEKKPYTGDQMNNKLTKDQFSEHYISDILFIIIISFGEWPCVQNRYMSTKKKIMCTNFDMYNNWKR